ncbi:MAG: tetratricopeptide repeat protein, partial [Butyrivibrio sp.]|nr:tetratricopeptide repeat protein [Butyrivibrio sp.]
MKKTVICLYMAAVLVLPVACGEKDRAQSYVTSAENAIATLQYDSAVSYAEQAVRAGEQPREALRLKGIACLKNARYEDAVSAFREALAMSDGIVTDMDYDMNLYLASACMGLGDFDGAVAAYDHILALKPTDVAGLYARGAALLQDGKLAEATKDFDR